MTSAKSDFCINIDPAFNHQHSSCLQSPAFALKHTEQMKKSVKLVKRSQSAVSSSQIHVPVIQAECSDVIRSWVLEFQDRSQERLRAFDSLFKKDSDARCLSELVGRDRVE